MNHTADQVRDEVVRSLFNGEGINLDALSPLDTICVQTRNSTYRIFLLDPKSGRSLIEGGHFAEPVDAVVSGAVVSESAIKFGWIGIGMRLEFWTNGGLVSTSPVQSFHVETPAPVESITIS